jgi:hypothetical protein
MFGANSDASSLTILGGNSSSGSLGNVGVNNNNPTARLDITQGNANLAPFRIRKNNVDKTTGLNQGELQYTSDNKLKFASTTDGTTLETIAFDSNVVHISGTETITGAKTFSVSPSVPAPTNDTDATNKAYVRKIAKRTALIFG